MHINFGDSNLIVQYIQNFLKDNYNKNIHLSDEYDKETHRALINYLQLPEILDSYKMKDLLISNFTFKNPQPPNELINGGGIFNFDFKLTPTEIEFYNRPINQCFDNGLRFINEYIDNIETFVKQYGWNLVYYTKFKFSNNEKNYNTLKFILRKDARKQILPGNEIINMINMYDNSMLLNKCFIDEKNSYHGFIQNSKFYKICYIPAKPGDTFTITHGYKYACEMAISYTEHTLEELKSDSGYGVEKIVSHLSSSSLGELNPGQYEIYNIPYTSNCKYLLVQMPYKNELILPKNKQIKIKIGDINQDGIINEQDYLLLKEYVESKELGTTSSTNLSGKSLIAANINKDIDVNGEQIVDRLDLNLFKSQLDRYKTTNIPIDFGETIYEQEIELKDSDFDRLLIMYGNIELGNKDNQLNIPINEYQTEPWAVHECFLPYILNSAIHKYSNINDIEWLQDKVSKINNNYNGIQIGVYDDAESYLANEYFIWNINKTIYEYYVNGLNTGYILDGDLYNGNLRRESTMGLSNMKILNGRFIVNDEWAGKLVLSSGLITKDLASNSLKEIIKDFQIKSNIFYKDKTENQIKFINGYVDPLTERLINQYTQLYEDE